MSKRAKRLVVIKFKYTKTLSVASFMQFNPIDFSFVITMMNLAVF